MTLTTTIGRKTRKTWAFERRLAARGKEYACPDCGVLASGPIPLNDHMRAKKHGPYLPRITQREAAA